MGTGGHWPPADAGEGAEPQHAAEAGADPPWKTQHDYAWGWFQYHAKQRTDMFNYFLVATGLLVNAYVGPPKGNSAATGGYVALFGFLTSLAFLALDWRNKQLVDRSVPVLRTIEVRWLFAHAPFRDDKLVERKGEGPIFLIHHSFVFRALQALLAAVWLALFVHALLAAHPRPVGRSIGDTGTPVKPLSAPTITSRCGTPGSVC